MKIYTKRDGLKLRSYRDEELLEYGKIQAEKHGGRYDDHPGDCDCRTCENADYEDAIFYPRAGKQA